MTDAPSIERRDVIVVGGGPAGSAVACLLARAGLDVLLLDRARFPRPKACAEYLSPEASRVLARLGVLEAIEAAGAAHLTGMTVHAPGGGVIRGEFAAARGFAGFRDRGLALPRLALDPLLLAAARRDGVTVREGTAVTGLRREATGRVAGVETSAGPVTAALVIGADGLRSVVSRGLGVARRARWFPRRVALVAHYEGVAGMGGHGEMHVARDGSYLGLADVGGGRTNVALVLPVSRAAGLAGDAEGCLARWIAAAPALGPRFAAASRVTPVRATGPFAQAARRAWGPGVALVGDAADFFDPFTGEGIYAALHGAELLAPHAAVAARARDARAAAAALRAYDRDRRAAFAGKWRVERLIGVATAWPALLDAAAALLARRPALGDVLVGIAGDVVPAGALLTPWTLRQLAGAAADAAAALVRGRQADAATPNASPVLPAAVSHAS